jgi:MFS family permease
MLVAIFALGRFGKRIPSQWLQSGMLIVTAISFGLLALISYDYTALHLPEVQVSKNITMTTLLVALTVMPLGFGLYVINTIAQTTLQRLTPEALRGRVFTVQFMMASLIGLAPLLIAATLADIIGIPAMLFWLSVGCLLVGAFSIYDAYHHRMDAI